MSPRPGARWGAAITISLLSALTISCGVGERGPSPIADEPRLDRLTARTQPPSTEPPNESSRNRPFAQVVWIQDDVLIRLPSTRTREPIGVSDLEAVNAVLQELSDGPPNVKDQPPTSAEAAILRSAVPRDSIQPPVTIGSGIATVTVTEEFRRAVGREQLLAVGQIVGTLASIPGIDRVKFTGEDGPFAVPLADGALTNDAVDPADYLALLKLPETDPQPPGG